MKFFIFGGKYICVFGCFCMELCLDYLWGGGCYVGSLCFSFFSI